MRGKEARAANMRSHVMEHRLRNSNAVVGGCSAAQFIEDDEGAGCRFGEDLFGFRELDEEGRLSGKDVVVGAEARHDAVDGCESGRYAGDITADLGHDHCDAGLRVVSK